MRYTASDTAIPVRAHSLLRMNIACGRISTKTSVWRRPTPVSCCLVPVGTILAGPCGLYMHKKFAAASWTMFHILRACVFLSVRAK